MKSSSLPMSRPGRVWLVVLTALLALGAALSARAQSSDDPPGRAARLSEVTGQVWLYSADGDEWVTVARNQPLTTGDRIATDNDARAEITLGTTTLRLSSGTELEIARLDDSRYSVVLRGGSVAARLRTAQAIAEFDLSTDEGRFRAQAVGRYRFDRFDQTSDVSVMAGQAIYEARNSALPVSAGQHVQFWVDAAGVPQYAAAAPLRDAFAGWNDERDRAEDRPVAATRFVSPEMTGAEDLDRYGEWQQSPEYGALWVPRAVAADWAPYSTGHWAWVRPWGWTWVDDAPWGFAPFHYGRWVYHRNAWCWAPGTYVARPVYAPALVAWIGGPRANVSIRIGGGAPVGWFPLAPREVYVPGYRSSPRYVREVNITHVTNVTQITTIVNNDRRGDADRRDFANRKYAHAVTFVPADVMTRRQPVGPAAARFRDDPQVRALVSDPRPGRVFAAAPVNAPPASPRAASGRPAPRPPFEGRAPGFAGRPEGQRPEGARVEAPRSEAQRPQGQRPEGQRVEGQQRPDGQRMEGQQRPDGQRVEGQRRPDGQRVESQQRPDGQRFEGRRPDGQRPDGRPGDRPGVGAAVATPSTASPPPVAAPAALAPPVAPPVTGAAPPNVGAPAGARREIDPATGRPAFRGGPRQERESAEAAAPQRVVPPSPVQRSEPIARPGLPTREMRTPADGAGGEVRGQVRGSPHPTDGPRGPEGARGPGRAPEAASPRPAAVAPPAPAPAPAPAAVAPPVQRAPEARPVEAQRPPGEGRMNRPEAPRGRGGDDRRDDKAERQK